jgi:response regulator RpfG family c-di-GMP phosphodiesterase
MAGPVLNKILVVDDTTSLVSPWKSEVAGLYKLFNVVGWFEAISRLRENPDIQAVVVNVSLKHVNGVEAVTKIREKHRSLPIIVIASIEDNRVVQNLRSHGIQESLWLPVNVEDMINRLKKYVLMPEPQDAPAPASPRTAEPQGQSGAGGDDTEADIKSKFYQAQSFFLNGDMDQAIKLFQTIAGEKRLKDSYLKYIEEAAYQEGRCWMRKKDFAHAVEVFKNFITKAPKSFFSRQALFYLANSYEMLKDNVKAVNFYTKVVSLNSMDSLATQAKKQIEKLK